jgi:hypothetical protein
MSALYNGNSHRINGMYYATDLPGRMFQGRSLTESDTFSVMPGMKTTYQIHDPTYNSRFDSQERLQGFSDSASINPIIYRTSDSVVSGPSSFLDRMLNRGSHTRKSTNLQDQERSFYNNLNEDINIVTNGNVSTRKYMSNDNRDAINKISRGRYNNQDFNSMHINEFYVDDDNRFNMIGRSNESHTRGHRHNKKNRDIRARKMVFNQIRE